MGATSARADGPVVLPAGQNTGRTPRRSGVFVPMPPSSFRDLLDSLDYDPAQRGPIVVVDPPLSIPAGAQSAGRELTPQSQDAQRTLAGVVQAMHMRLVSAGHLNAVVPDSHVTLNPNPGRAKLLAGMETSDLARVLFASLSPAQWVAFGSPGGIGYADLSSDTQREVWAALFPGPLDIVKHTMQEAEVAGGKSVLAAYPQTIPVADPATARLRINRQVSFSFHTAGTPNRVFLLDPSWMATAKLKNGDITWDVTGFGKSSEPAPAGSGFLFGVPIKVPVQAAQPKPGQLDFDSAGLNPRIALGTPANPVVTAGELIDRVTAATGYTFACDRRLRDTPVWTRGDSARAGDLLNALARGAGGAFRKLDATSPGEKPVYLLTEDVEGIGARVAKIAEWYGDSSYRRDEMLRDAMVSMRKNKPLSHIGFAPGDPNDPGPEIAQAIDAGLQDPHSAEAAAAQNRRVADLSPAMQEIVKRELDLFTANNPTVPLDRGDVSFKEQLQVSLLVPEAPDTGVPIRNLQTGSNMQFIERLARDSFADGEAARAALRAKQAPAGADIPPPPSWPETSPRNRILIAAPGTPADATAITKSAVSHGFDEVWLEAGAGSDSIESCVDAAIREAGGKIKVGVSLRLLRNSGLPGAEPERDILGETGAEFAERRIKTGPPAPIYEYLRGYRLHYRYTGWDSFPRDSAVTEGMARRIAALAALPGLAGITLRSSTPPGFDGLHEGGDGMEPGGALGYTLADRRAFLFAHGIDPIDLPEPPFALRAFDWNLGRFIAGDNQGDYRFVGNAVQVRPASDTPRLELWDWRHRASDSFLSDLYSRIRAKAPAVALNLDDRNSEYANVPFAWFAGWDTASGFPDISPYRGEASILAGIRRKSKRAILVTNPGYPEEYALSATVYGPSGFARGAARSAGDAGKSGWDGFAVDMSAFDTATMLRLLDGLASGTR